MSSPQMSDSSTSSETIVSFAMFKRSDLARAQLTQRPDEVQHADGMAAGIDAVENVPHGAPLDDDESGAGDARFHGSVGVLLVHHPVLPANFALGVREQPDRNAVLVAEVGVAKAIVRTHPEHDAVVAGEPIFAVANNRGVPPAAPPAGIRMERKDDQCISLGTTRTARLHSC